MQISPSFDRETCAGRLIRTEAEIRLVADRHRPPHKPEAGHEHLLAHHVAATVTTTVVAHDANAAVAPVPAVTMAVMTMMSMVPTAVVAVMTTPVMPPMTAFGGGRSGRESSARHSQGSSG